jgi:hypothetical protein
MGKHYDHRAELICNVGNIGSDWFLTNHLPTRNFLLNRIKSLYKYILFPLSTNEIKLAYLSVKYCRWRRGYYDELVGEHIRPNQTHSISKDPTIHYWLDKLVYHYSEGISILSDESGRHEYFYKNVWKQNTSVWFAPIKYSFKSECDNVYWTELEFSNFSHLMLYLGKCEYYCQLVNVYKQKYDFDIYYVSNFPMSLELFMSDTFNVNITAHNKYSKSPNIGIDSSPTLDSKVLPISQPWALKMLCWFFLKYYYPQRNNVWYNILPKRLYDQLKCIEFDQY